MKNTDGQRQVGRSFRKMCSKCGADVTFASKTLSGDGSYLCEPCANASPREPEPTTDFFPGVDLAPGQSPPSASQPPGKGKVPPLATSGAVPVTAQPMATAPDRIVVSKRGVIVACIVAAVILFSGGGYFLYDATFGKNNRELALLARVRADREEPDKLLARSQPVEAYDRYRPILDLVQEVKTTYPPLLDEVDSLTRNAKEAEAKAKPVLEKRAADEKARKEAEARAKAEAERLAAEAKRKAEEAERERKAQEALAREQRRIRLQFEARLARVRTSPKFVEMKQRASESVLKLRQGLATEDSAYRGMSRRSETAGELLATYLRMRAMVDEKDVSRSIDRVEQQARVSLVGEDSAIRATYKRQMVIMQLTSVWAELLGDKVTINAVSSAQLSASSILSGDDSAIRAIYQYTRAGMNCFAALATGTGNGASAARVLASVEADNLGDDSAWRAARRCAGGMLELLLVLSDLPPDARQKIRSDVDIDMIGEDSALRAYGKQMDGVIETLRAMIAAM